MVGLLAALLAGLHSAGADPLGYGLEGTFEYQTFAIDPHGPAAWRYSGSFTGIVAGARWYLSMRPTELQSSDPRTRLFKECIAASDGTNLYQVHSPELIEYTNQLGQVVKQKLDGTAVVECGPVPRRFSPSVAKLWQAVASGFAFHTLPPETMPPPWAPPIDINLPGTNMGISVELEPNPEPPFIPNQVTYVWEANGEPASSMQVEARAKVNGLSIPTMVTLRTLVKGATAAQMRVKVSRVWATEAHVQPVPVLAALCHVTDFRFAQSNPPVMLQYPARSWLSYNAAQELYYQRVNRIKAAEHSTAVARKRGIVLWAILLLASFPVVAGLYGFYTHKAKARRNLQEPAAGI